jgi:hypothetical protein
VRSRIHPIALNGSGITKPLTLILTVMLGGCVTTQPIARTNGNVERLMKMPEYKEIRESSPQIKRWASEALHSVNDLEYEARSK